MNRRQFITNSVIASIASMFTGFGETKSQFPETIEQMRRLVGTCVKVNIREEASIVLPGLNKTITPISTFWFYREGNRIAVLHRRLSDGTERFSINEFDNMKPIYTPPISAQWAQNRKCENYVQVI